jgi:Putative bacterial sensory transduction regulator
MAVSAADVVDTYVRTLPGETRRLAHTEWGISISPEHAGGYPLDVGVRIADGILTAQAFALPANEHVNPWTFLHWNRGTRFARFACTSAGDIWVHGDLPVSAVDSEAAVDRLLGLVVEGALAAREYAFGKKAEAEGAAPASGGGWLPAS